MTLVLMIMILILIRNNDILYHTVNVDATINKIRLLNIYKLNIYITRRDKVHAYRAKIQS